MAKIRSAIVITHFNPRWMRIYAEITRRELAEGAELSLVDLDNFSFLPRSTFGGQAFLRTLVNQHPQIRMLKFGPISRSNPSVSQSISFDYEELARSEILSYFKNDRPRGRIFKTALNLARNQINELLLQKELLTELSNLDKIYVANGRAIVHQVLLKLKEIHNLSFQVLYLETGLPNNPVGDYFFLENFPIHDRVRRQEAILAASFDMTTVLKTADVWLSRRIVPNSDYNSFSAGWNNFGKEGHMAFRNVFFNSSTDEYWALGGSWLNPNWASQYQAFGAIISRLKSLGESSFLLRLHPNLLNKSLDFIRSELKEIHELKRLHPQLTIIWPHESVNSYSLVEAAERVFVSMSTIGLEASLMGKSVWLTGPSGYDEVADVRKLHSPEEVQSSLLAPWEVCKENAAKYIAYWHWESTAYRYQTSRLHFPLLLTLPFRKLALRVLFRLGSARRPWGIRSVTRLMESP